MVGFVAGLTFGIPVPVPDDVTTFMSMLHFFGTVSTFADLCVLNALHLLSSEFTAFPVHRFLAVFASYRVFRTLFSMAH